MSAFFITVFYGGGDAGSFYGSSSADIPVDLRFYRTNVDGHYVFHWGFLEALITPLLSSFDFELQLDTTDTFSSSNLVSYTSSTAFNYQNGDVRKGFEIVVEPREEKVEQLWYARVRAVVGFANSDWSEIMPFVIPQRWELEKTENLVNSLPDFHVYNKEDLRRVVSQRTTNIYTVMNMYGRELDKTKLENLLTTTNIYVALCRDEELYDNFGIYFDYKKPASQEWVEYRECLRMLILAALVGGTYESIVTLVKCFTGVSPTFLLIRDLKDLFLNTIFELPLETPDGVRVDFSISSPPFMPGSMVVLQNGVVLVSGVDYTENASIPGFTMTVAPTALDTLEVMYDVGAPGDPVPLIADIITLTGTGLFTNASTTLSGTDTNFLTELSPGDIVTDINGSFFATVSSVGSNTSATLTSPWGGPTVSSIIQKVGATFTDVPPALLWDKGSLAHGLIIRINNPGLFGLEQELIVKLIGLLMPAHVKYFVEFV